MSALQSGLESQGLSAQGEAMNSHAYKKVNNPPTTDDARLVVQYNPAQAVRARGDGWLYGSEVWNISNSTHIALSDPTSDQSESALMRLMEKGQIPRVQE